jgi:hypothetical protein
MDEDSHEDLDTAATVYLDDISGGFVCRRRGHGAAVAEPQDDDELWDTVAALSRMSLADLAEE